MKSAKIMFLYAGFLVACGIAAFALAGFQWRAKTALFASGGTAALVIICGLLAQQFPRNRRVGMIGIHVGLFLLLFFGCTFGFLGYKRFTAADPVIYLATIFVIMALGSFAAFAAILSARPKPADRIA